MMGALTGYKTYIAAAGLLGKAIYELSQGNLNEAVNDFLAALAVFGLRAAVGTSGLTAAGRQALGQ